MKNRFLTVFALITALAFGSVSLPAVAKDRHWSPKQHQYYHNKHQRKYYYNYHRGKRHPNYYGYHNKYRAKHYYKRYRYYPAPRHYHPYSAPRIIFGFSF